MIARKFEQHKSAPQLKIVEPAIATTPPGHESWFAVVRLNGVPRIVMIDDIQDRTGFTYIKCILMGCGTVVWVAESCLIMWVFPPSELPKRSDIAKYDYVRLVNGQTAFIIEIQGDLITVITEGDDVLQLARWDVLRVIVSELAIS